LSLGLCFEWQVRFPLKHEDYRHTLDMSSNHHTLWTHCCSVAVVDSCLLRTERVVFSMHDAIIDVPSHPNVELHIMIRLLGVEWGRYGEGYIGCLIRSRNCLSFASTWGFLVGYVLLIFLVFCVVLLCVLTFWVPCCDVRYDFHIKKLFCLSLPPVVCRRVHVLFTLFVFVWV
jgi:hypothetical protein